MDEKHVMKVHPRVWDAKGSNNPLLKGHAEQTLMARADAWSWNGKQIYSHMCSVCTQITQFRLDDVSDQIADDCGCLDLWNRSKACRSPVNFSCVRQSSKLCYAENRHSWMELNGDWRIGLVKNKRNCLMERVEGPLTLPVSYRYSKVFPFTIWRRSSDQLEEENRKHMTAKNLFALFPCLFPSWCSLTHS